MAQIGQLTVEINADTTSFMEGLLGTHLAMANMLRAIASNYRHLADQYETNAKDMEIRADDIRGQLAAKNLGSPSRAHRFTRGEGLSDLTMVTPNEECLVCGREFKDHV